MSEDETYLSLKGDTNYWLKHLQLLNVGRVARVLSEKDKEIERLHSIIKEAREYIEQDIKANYFKRYDDEVYKLCDELLEILQGEQDENNSYSK